MSRTGRPREFDRDQALSQARDVFWTRGYANTSVQDLVDQLGVQRGSLYGTFGDKHALYLEAVALYWRENRAQIERRLASGPVLPALRQMLLQPGVITGAPVRRGCLVGNTTAQLDPTDTAAHTLISEAYEEFLDIVSDALRRGQDTGEIATAAPPQAQAGLILLLFQGSALITRGMKNAEGLAASVDLALGALRPVSR